MKTNILLKISCVLTGESYKIVKTESIKSIQKITTYGSLMIMMIIIWGINGYFLSKNIFNNTVAVSLAISIFCMFLIYVIESSVIKMSSVGTLMAVVRLSLALISALIGSIIIDEIMFKSDIEGQLHSNSQTEVIESLNQDPGLKQLKTQLADENRILNEKDQEIKNLRNSTNQESETGVGPRTNLLKSELNKLEVEQSNSNIKIQMLNNSIASETRSLRLTIPNESGILKNIAGLCKYLNSHPSYWAVWGFFFALSLIIELLVLIIKATSLETSYEVKKKRQDELRILQLNNIYGERTDPIREGLRNLYSNVSVN